MHQTRKSLLWLEPGVSPAWGVSSLRGLAGGGCSPLAAVASGRGHGLSRGLCCGPSTHGHSHTHSHFILSPSFFPKMLTEELGDHLLCMSGGGGQGMRLKAWTPHPSGRHEVDAQHFFHQMASGAGLRLGFHGGLQSWVEVLMPGDHDVLGTHKI